MIYIKLYLAFLNIGIFSFGGGYATLPLIQKYIVEENHWITMDTMLDLISISQMTPGPIAINSASFVGNKLAGILGSIIATLGVITPQIIILSLFLYFLPSWVNKYLKGINAAVVALILIATIKLMKSSLFLYNNIVFYILFLFIFVLYYKKIDIIKLIILGGIVGFITSF
ncbi:chromate transporter [Oceanivirga miroungae]|uniref:Chromate transporter n=1 Tax=Oceanivirga miroungae TaxID=1130046 RepID=A0A6I8M6Q2_9FUSO|nr:chromate transporter [Oceanivirga miroungae]VWL85065.1 chromate transporter [Oceanivirga miroungae]